jgi:hypothetical protein
MIITLLLTAILLAVLGYFGYEKFKAYRQKKEDARKRREKWLEKDNEKRKQKQEEENRQKERNEKWQKLKSRIPQDIYNQAYAAAFDNQPRDLEPEKEFAGIIPEEERKEKIREIQQAYNKGYNDGLWQREIDALFLKKGKKRDKEFNTEEEQETGA